MIYNKCKSKRRALLAREHREGENNDVVYERTRWVKFLNSFSPSLFSFGPLIRGGNDEDLSNGH